MRTQQLLPLFLEDEGPKTGQEVMPGSYSHRQLTSLTCSPTQDNGTTSSER